MMQLSDLAKVLSQEPEAEVQFDLFARIDQQKNIFYVSRFWDSFDEASRRLGRKSDVYLKSFGNVHFSELSVFPHYLQKATEYRNTKFAKQIFSLLEDLRVEQQSIQQRPGMLNAFQKRRELYQKIFTQKLASFISHDYELDKLLYQMYLYVTSPIPIRHELPSLIGPAELPSILDKAKQAQNTAEIMKQCLEMMKLLDERYQKDCQEQFFGISSQETSYLTFDDLRRRDEVHSVGKKEKDNEKNEASPEKMMTWHQDTAVSEQTLLQFDVAEGTNTDVVGDDIRMSESNDQVFASIQGNSVQTDQRSYDIKKLKEQKLSLEHTEDSHQNMTNKAPIAIHLAELVPQYKDWNEYMEICTQQDQHRMALIKTWEKSIEQKRNEQRSNLLKGRLGKKLVSLVVDEMPRPFYKKQEDSKQKDAVFSLLVDCSSSMSTKMNKVKKAIILFHETLYSLSIPHNVTGFWEESAVLNDGPSHNYFQPVITFENCNKRLIGSAILQMEPKEDNRDGFAIREMTSLLKVRGEAQKFLFVFSDGEPSAANYGEDGVLDTYKAVTEARKQGIHVIGIFLSNMEVSEKDVEMMKMLYGNSYVALYDMNTLSESIATMLRKILIK